MSLVLPFYYGTISQLDTKKKDNKIYKWLCFVRGPDNEDLSPFIDNIKFKLHESFENNTRTISEYPFIIYEEGWGEFELKIIITLKEEYNKLELTLNHFLKFQLNKTSKKPFLHQNYDEIIFTNPSEDLINNSKLLISKNDDILELLNNKFGYDNKEIYQYILSENKINFKTQVDYLNNAIEFIDSEIKNSLKELMNFEDKIEQSNLLEKRENFESIENN